jgi:hypothetical protein
MMQDMKKSEVYKLTKSHYAEYLVFTLIVYGVEMLGGMFIENVDVVFSFAAAIAGSALAFIFPGSFYVVLSKKYVDASLA